VVRLEVKNIKNVEAALKKYGDVAVKEFGRITKDTAQEILGTAKILAPKDEGARAGIVAGLKSEQQESPLHYKVTAYATHSAYQEFGTGGLVNINEGWGEMARQFIGKGIRQVNLSPQPFMYPAFVKGRKIFNDDLKDSIKHLNNKFNNG
jgi:HK97 gp10 family phage protein